MNEGRIEQIGSPQEVWDTPATPFVYGFLGDANQFRGRWHNGVFEGNGWRFQPVQGAPHEGEGVAFVRPHDIAITKTRNGAQGAAVVLEHVYLAGSQAFLALRQQDNDQHVIEARISDQHFRDLNLKKGEALMVQPRRLRFFPEPQRQPG